jgi:putative flippase GtrA
VESFRAGLARSVLRWEKLFHQFLKFGVVGALATATHVSLYVLLVEWPELDPLTSNFLAFCVALLVTFLGNYHWTFAEEVRSGKLKRLRSFLKLSLAALTGLALNSAIVVLIVDILRLEYLLAIPFMVTLVPVVTFLITRLWAFRPSTQIGTAEG